MAAITTATPCSAAGVGKVPGVRVVVPGVSGRETGTGRAWSDDGVRDVVVIGAGQAGLSAAYHLRRAGPDPLVLDGGRGPGGAWQDRWDSLTMAETHAVHDLPGVPLPAGDPEERANVAVPRYYAAYERENDLRVVRPVTVHEVAQDPDDPALLRVRATVGTGPDARERTVRTRTVVNATGTWTRPFWPRYPGMETFRGRQLHTHDFRAAEDFAGQHVVVVGGGASATQLLLQVAPHASGTTWVTRREPVWVEEEFSPELGRAAVARVAERTSAGLPPGGVVSVTGRPLTPRYRAGIASGVLRRRPMCARVTATGDESSRGWVAGRVRGRAAVPSGRRHPRGDGIQRGARPPRPARAARAGRRDRPRRHDGGPRPPRPARRLRAERVHDRRQPCRSRGCARRAPRARRDAGPRHGPSPGGRGCTRRTAVGRIATAGGGLRARHGGPPGPTVPG